MIVHKRLYKTLIYFRRYVQTLRLSVLKAALIKQNTRKLTFALFASLLKMPILGFDRCCGCCYLQIVFNNKKIVY